MRNAIPMNQDQVTKAYDAHINLVESFRTGTGARQGGFSIPRPSVEVMKKTIAKGVEMPEWAKTKRSEEGLVSVVTK